MLNLRRVLLLTVLSLTALPVATSSAALGDPVLDAEEKSFCTQINQYRAANGRAPLRVSVSLTNASKWMSNDMATKNRFSHTDSLGRTFGVRLTAFGYGFPTWRGEIIAAGLASGASTFEQWRASPGHNNAMLNANYTVMGIGRAYSATSSYKYYWTTDFGGYVDRTIPC
jgi:uncharacterized protein YkwD